MIIGDLIGNDNPKLIANDASQAAYLKLALDKLGIDYQPVEHATEAGQKQLHLYVSKNYFNQLEFDHQVEIVVQSVKMKIDGLHHQFELDKAEFSDSF